jgi:hypothetical protein
MRDGQKTCAAIRGATTPEGVIAVLLDYVATLSPAEAALVPASLTNLAAHHAAEVAAAAVDLARREALVENDAPEAEFLKEVATVLSTAAMRLAVLIATVPEKAES